MEAVKVQKNKETIGYISKGLLIIGITLLFLLSIDLIGGSFQRLSGGVAQSLLSATSNPFISLFIGLLITAIIQSSSTVTSMVVALVGSGTLSLTHAIPIVMGANIGTTITSTIISLGFITSRREFRKAISAGTIHDFYNILLTIILFPLEYFHQTLSIMSREVASWIAPALTDQSNSFQTTGIFHSNPISNFIFQVIDNNWIVLVISLIILFVSIKVISRIIYGSLIGKSKERINQYIFDKPLKSFAWGTLLTAAVQSSSVTTPLVVPLVATGKISLRKAFPFIIGANIGTTVTALIAALFNSEAAISIAIAHFLFNLTGVLLFMPFPLIRKVPVLLALQFGKLTMTNRIYGFLYILITFFILPFILIYFN